MRVRRGFSLVELLVVIGIIALLISIMLPTLARVRETGNALKCSAQLHQIGLAIANYAAMNQSRTPAWSHRHEYPVDSYAPDPADPLWSGPGWPVLLERYIGQKPDGKIFNCPSFPDTTSRQNYFLAARWMHEQVPLLRSIPMGKIKNSSNYIMSGDCVVELYYPPAFGIDPAPNEDIDKDDGPIKCLAFIGEPGGYNMHRVGNNVLFADGHVQIYKAWNPDEMTCSPVSKQTWDSCGPE